jgi:hypothetical protein
MQTKRKIKNYLLFPRIQFRYIIVTILTSAITTGIALYQITNSFSYLRNVANKVNPNTDSAFHQLLRLQEKLIMQNVLIALLIGLLLSIIINFIITHRTLGPFYRIKQYFVNYSENEDQPIRFRQTDYFKELEDDINRVINSKK